MYCPQSFYFLPILSFFKCASVSPVVYCGGASNAVVVISHHTFIMIGPSSGAV